MALREDSAYASVGENKGIMDTKIEKAMSQNQSLL
jgi:hypothetical protein